MTRDVVEEIAATVRCDHLFGDEMKVVRSRLVERMGVPLYKKCMAS